MINKIGLSSKGFVDFLNNETMIYKNQILTIIQRTKLFANKYPKMIIFILSIILAYHLFNDTFFSNMIENLGTFKYLGEFIGGLLFSFGFTTSIAVAIFLKLNPSNIFLASMIGGAGALISDLVIFKFIKFSFEDEFEKLRDERPFLFIKHNFMNQIHPKISHYLTFAFAGFLFASPLPDEAAVMVLAGISEINIKTLAITSFVFNSIGIFIFLLI